MSRKPFFLAALVLVSIGLWVPTRGVAHEGLVRVLDAWARATPSVAKEGAVYLAVVNTGDSADRLIGAETPVAESVELHASVRQGKGVTMRKLGAVEVPSGHSEIFRPGGTHLMLLGLRKQLKEGDSFRLTLRFERAGTVEVSVRVVGLGTKEADSRHSHNGGTHKH
jgi:copper(I)-binding protein